MIGYNIHSQRGVDQNKLFSHIAKLPPSPQVVIDGAELAFDIQHFTGQTVYHRRLGGLPQHDNLHRIMTPVQFIQHIQPDINAGLGIYALNEPSWNDTIPWLLDVAKLLVAQGAKAVLGNYSIGTPEPTPEVFERITPLILYIQQHWDLLALGLHEGSLNHWLNGVDGFTAPDYTGFDVARESMWYSGRFRRLYDYFGRFPIVITEFTTDNIAGNPDGAPIHRIGPIWDRLYGRSDTQIFAAEQVAQVLEHIYNPYDIPIMLYCYGEATPQWTDYNFAKAVQFQQELERLLKPKESPMATKTYQIETSDTVNIRVDPTTNAARIGSLVNGDVIQVHMQGEQPDIIEAEGYKWMRIIKGDVEGYAASDFFTLVAPASSIKQELQALANQLQSTISRLD